MTNPTIPAPTESADVMLLNGRRVPAEFYGALRGLVLERIPDLNGWQISRRFLCNIF